MKDPSKAAADALLADLPTLLPDDPAMAAIIAEEMAKQFAAGGSGAQSPSVPTKTPNKGDDQPRGKTSPDSTPGSFAPAAGGSSLKQQNDPKGKSTDADKTKPDEFGYSLAQRGKIGQSGKWNDLGLPAMRDIPADPPVVFNKIEESTARILAGETVVNPFGETLRVDKESLGHINKKGRSPKQLQDKLQTLDAAEETARHPHEIWLDESNGVRVYVRITEESTGRRVVNACDESPNHLFSWHTSPASYDHWRKGKLLWIRK